MSLTKRFAPATAAFLIAFPLIWAVLLFLHPKGDTTAFYPVITDAVVQWQVVHVGMVICIPLMGGAIFLLVRGMDGRAAKIARLAVAPFIVFYGAFEILVGVGTGILVAEVDELPESQRAIGESLVEDFAESSIPFIFTALGGAGLTIALIAAGMAYFRSGDGSRHLAPVILLALAAPLIGIHEPPAGPAGLALFVIAVLTIHYRRDGSEVQQRAASSSSQHKVQEIHA